MPFITFEGIDGAGKTTQAGLLVGYLKRRGIPVVFTKEPGGTELGNGILPFIFDPKTVAKASLFLFLADRAQHVSLVIRPSLEKGIWVVCDRFSDSTLAYQGYGLGLNVEKVLELNEFSTGGLSPDLTFVLDIPAQEAKRRLSLRGGLEGFDLRDQGFLERVRLGFAEVSRKFPERVVVLDGTKDKMEIHKRVLDELSARFSGLL